MPSPFPGMDPWLEDAEVFPNLHDRLIIAIQDALGEVLPKGYLATSRNRVWVDAELRRDPDVSIVDRLRRRPRTGGPTTELAGLTVVGVEGVSDPIEEPYLEIVTASGRRLVTAVEVISLSNKRAGKKGRKSYRQKQDEYRKSGVHLVEIDLLRAGPYVSAVPQRRMRPAVGPFDYHVSVVTAGKRASYFGCGIRLADRLPAFGIPLDPGVPPVTVDLQPMVDMAYDRAKYAEWVDYRQPPDPPLAPDQQAWADGVLKAKGILPT